MRPLRIEVDDEHGTVGLVIDAAPPCTPGQQARLTDLAGQAVRDLADLPGVHGQEHARQILLCLLTRRHADERAHARIEAARAPAMIPLF